jgi:DNA-binding PadR family transcriptional regulator
MHRHRKHERCMRGSRTEWGDWGGRRHGMGGRGRHGGGGRMFDQGDLRLVVLALIAEQPRHGYELIKEIEARSGGAYAPSPGVIYPLLTMLEEMGFARLDTSDGAKKLYAITPEGEADLAANQAAAEHLKARMASVRESTSSGRAPQIVRAMENLRIALRLRMERGPLSETQIQAVAAALDAAAQAVERS